ncbi:MAG: cob(I)yrinic acid a,c-diamide adenosyltransferase [Gammaproteobacteria bacterium]|nr:cob(I)yrinic acid a,c-diamide adenosyltransferase [Gammaproteobacteria bacterium]
MKNNSIDDSICPLCQKKNHCQARNTALSCWCHQKVIPEELIARVPEELKNKTCICQSCVDAYHKKKYQQKCQTKKDLVDKGIAQATIERGQVLLITGNGKGKSTAGFGVVLRSVGHGYKAAVAQFIKGQWACGERNLLLKHDVPFSVMKTGFTWDTQDKAGDIKAAEQVWQEIKPFLSDERYHIVLLDELTYMLSYQYLDKEEVLTTIANRPEEQTVVITGRGAISELKEVADTVSEIKDTKHAYRQGLKARKGIDW